MDLQTTEVDSDTEVLLRYSTDEENEKDDSYDQDSDGLRRRNVPLKQEKSSPLKPSKNLVNVNNTVDLNGKNKAQSKLEISKETENDEDASKTTQPNKNEVEDFGANYKKDENKPLSNNQEDCVNHGGNNASKAEVMGSGGGSLNPSPCHSWRSNSSSTTNLFETDEEYDGDGGEDDYEYDPYTHEYVPKIRVPPSDEDSDDGLLVSREARDRSLSVIAQALLESARMNQERHEAELEQRRASQVNGGLIVKSRNCFMSLMMAFRSSQKLRKIDEMPEYLRFNRFIHDGYRELQDFWGCVSSMSYLHNETFNILTHIIPIIYILLYWRTMFPWDEILGNSFLNMLGWSHIAASISPWIGSVTYHLFMSYNKGGEKFYQLLLQADMFGIWITECFGALCNLTAAVWCLPHDYQTAIMTAYGLAALFGLQKALTAWTPVARRMCFAPVFISRILAFILRLSRWGGGDPNILIHIILQDVLSIGGGIIGIIRVPEKWFPGRLDMVFNSHHIMHILVVVAVCHMNAATNGDVRWIINNYSQSQCA